MSPSSTVKRSVRYPFYVSSAILRGRKSDAGSVNRALCAATQRYECGCSAMSCGSIYVA
jgi:hypothetical protein